MLYKAEKLSVQVKTVRRKTLKHLIVTVIVYFHS